MTFKQITFENWKSFRHATLYIDPLTVLIGTNASGKSNALRLPPSRHGFQDQIIIADDPPSGSCVATREQVSVISLFTTVHVSKEVCQSIAALRDTWCRTGPFFEQHRIMSHSTM